jgi:hypothetical protein
MNRRDFLAGLGGGMLGTVGAPLIAAAGSSTAGRRVALIDSRWVAHSHFLTRRMARPERVSEEPVIAPAGAAATILPADRGGFQMWYSTVRSVAMKGGKTHQSWIHYATTRDGVEFVKPDLGINGSNVLIKANSLGTDGKPLTGIRGCSGFSVVDANRQKLPHARSRYTAFYRSWVPGRHGGLSLAHSEDGLRWTEYPENPVKILQSDTYNNFFYDARIGKYVAYVRPSIHAGHRHVNRSVARIISNDIVHWSDEQIVLDTDDRDAAAVGNVDEATLPDGTRYPRGRNKQFYGLTVKSHGDLYLGFASLYDVRPGLMTIELAHSYNGIDWRREPDRMPLIIPGASDAWDSAVVYYPVSGCPIEIGDDWFIYYHGINMNHHGEIKSRPDLGEYRAMGAVRLKRDRLVGYQVGAATGELLSRAFRCDGRKLFLNANAQSGPVRVSICKPSGNPIRGFTFNDSRPIRGDSVRHPVIFENGDSLKALAGKEIRLRIEVKHVSVFGWETV